MKVTVLRSAVIEAPIERVWAVLRDFGGWRRWHPSVAESRMENDFDGDVVGVEMREQLLHHSDRDHSLTHSILDSPLPLFESVATIRLKPVTDGDRTLWLWRWTFRTPDDRAGRYEMRIARDVCEASFTGIRTFLAEKEKPGATAAAPPEEMEGMVRTGRTQERLLPSRAVVVETAGGPEVLALKQGMVPAPGPYQVRLRQTAVAVNTLDLRQRAGAAEGLDMPGTPGVEAAGEIIDVGEHANGFFPGDRVVYLSRTPGAYAEIRCIEADACMLLPDEVNEVDAAVLLKGVTAALLLDRVFRAAPGAVILIEAAAEGTGHLLTQWAQTRELTVIGTAATDDQARFSRDRGCGHPVVGATGPSLAAEVMRITNGRGVDYWVHRGDAFSLETAVSCLARCGHLAAIGAVGNPHPALDLNDLKRRSLTVSAPSVVDYLNDRTYLQRLVQQLFAKMQSGEISPSVVPLPLSEAAEAHRRIEQQGAMGALALLPGK